MKDALVQYVGFEAKATAREYTFTVKDAGEPRLFTFTIDNEAFASHRVLYQDAPSICALKLRTELLAFANHPSETHYQITGAELDSYRESHSPKPIRNLYRPHADQNND